jgi:DUF4097 and DUF4098 domain-containing protein YvlB
MRIPTFAVASLLAVAGTPAFAWNNNAASCEDVNIRFGSSETVRSEETVRIPGSDLSISPGSARNLGVRIVGWSGSGYEVTLCRAAAESEARALNQIHLRQGRGTLSIDGPDGGSWNAYLLVKAPVGARIEAETNNGPLSVADVDGRFTARVKNGPVSVQNVRGDVDVTAANGPISYRGSAGEVRLKASNGPISISLDEAGSFRGSLEAETRNGPLTLKVSPSFGSSVLVETSGRAPFRCPASLCGEAIRTASDSPRRVEVGRGPQNVRLRAHNGPVSIKAD